MKRNRKSFKWLLSRKGAFLIILIVVLIIGGIVLYPNRQTPVVNLASTKADSQVTPKEPAPVSTQKTATPVPQTPASVAPKVAETPVAPTPIFTASSASYPGNGVILPSFSTTTQWWNVDYTYTCTGTGSILVMAYRPDMPFEILSEQVSPSNENGEVTNKFQGIGPFNFRISYNGPSCQWTISVYSAN